MSQIQCIYKCIHISILEECIVQIKKDRETAEEKKTNNSYSTQFISLRNLLIKRKKKNRHLKAYVELDGPSSGSIKVCRVNTAMSYCPFIFQQNKKKNTDIYNRHPRKSILTIKSSQEERREKKEAGSHSPPVSTLSV